MQLYKVVILNNMEVSMKLSMKKIVYIFVIITAILCYILIDFSNKYTLYLPDNNGNCIPDEYVALKYGKALYEELSGTSYENSSFNVIFIEEYNEWNIYLKDIGEENGEYSIMGERGIYINKDTGTVTRIIMNY